MGQASNDTESDEKLIKKLAKTEADGNRFILARIPLIKNGETGEQELVRSGADPTDSNRILQASSLVGDTNSNALTEALRRAGDKGDVHLANYLDIPGKDNGFDIEGLAVTVQSVFVELRGPVLRGWAIILELSIQTSDPARLVLKNFSSHERPYKKHFLDLGGLGIRELCVSGEDLLVLAGPTMILDGPTKLYRWKGALDSTDEILVRRDQLMHEFDVPFGSGMDHAEGIALVPGNKQSEQILVVFDSPSKQRKEGVAGVRADVFELQNN